MSLICLIGRHGTGKSTFAGMLGAYGFEHFSVGTLRRLARRGEFPVDVPVSLMLALRRIPNGEMLPDGVVKQLIEIAKQSSACVLDGLPATPAHIELLPADALTIYMHTVSSIRTARLQARAEVSLRKWHADYKSTRDLSLAAVVRRLRADRRIVLVRNDGDLGRLEAVAARIAVRTQFSSGAVLE